MIVFTAILSFSVNGKVNASQNEPKPSPKKILFIGNSYTACIKENFTNMLNKSPYKQTICEFIVRGGFTLQWHLASKTTRERIKTGKWDFVILQDQSQMPALPGKYTESFHRSVDAWTKLIRDAGAEPVLFMTWGYRDGGVMMNKEVFPNYEVMQKKLSAAYQTAAKRNKISLAPVGQVWSLIRQQDETLGKALYEKDGSHPSSKGAAVTTYVFFQTLFNEALESIQCPDALKEHEWQIIKEVLVNGNTNTSNNPTCKKPLP